MRTRGYTALLLVAAVLSSVSCAREGTGVGDRVYVSFTAAPSTKAASVDGVGTLDLLVFRSNGAVETYAREDASEITASVAAGSSLRWYLVANAPAGSLASVVSESALVSKLSMLAESSASAFVMAASGTRVFSGSEQVSAELDRLACKVTLESFTPQFLASAYEGSDVRMTGLFLINVVGSCPYGMTPAAGDWLNMMGVDASLPAGVAPLLQKSFDMPLTSARVDGPWSLYCMPNPVANGVHSGTAPAWSPRNTRLVLEISIDGVRSWYPMDLPAMQCNHEYVIRDVRLLGEGSGHRDIPVSRSGIAFDVTVNAWGAESKDITF